MLHTTLDMTNSSPNIRLDGHFLDFSLLYIFISFRLLIEKYKDPRTARLGLIINQNINYLRFGMPLFKDLTDEASKAKEALSSILEYDFVAFQVCSAYSMIREEMLRAQAFHNTNEHGFKNNCGPERYGYDAVRMLIFIAC
jgi:hypothetical protein